jgi:hypothetical protein
MGVRRLDEANSRKLSLCGLKNSDSPSRLSVRMLSTRVLFHLRRVGFVIQRDASHKGQCLYIGRLTEEPFLV